jgi:hypothetical protein
MAARITKRSAVTLPRWFGAPFRRLACRSARLPLRRLPSPAVALFNSRWLEPGSLPGGTVGEASGCSARLCSVREDPVSHICAAFAVSADGTDTMRRSTGAGCSGAFPIYANANGRGPVGDSLRERTHIALSFVSSRSSLPQLPLSPTYSSSSTQSLNPSFSRSIVTTVATTPGTIGSPLKLPSKTCSPTETRKVSFGNSEFMYFRVIHRVLGEYPFVTRSPSLTKETPV